MSVWVKVTAMQGQRTGGAQVAARGVSELGLVQDLVQARGLRGAHTARARVRIHARLHLADQPPCRMPGQYAEQLL